MIEYKIASVDSIIVYFADHISRDNVDLVQSNYIHIKNLKHEGLIDIIPSYTSILFHYDLRIFDFKSIVAFLQEHIALDRRMDKEEGRLIEIPIYYDESVGFDLAHVAKEANLSIQEVIAIHSSCEYLVYSIGFLPGFAYLGEVDKRIATPRLTSPRSKIPRGSLGIADNQSAIYPVQSPGGWNIVGRTYQDMFDKKIDGFSYLNVGDRVKFLPIDKDEFLKNGGVI
ncbi:5-oxoprolinase subunit PxpB [Sulfurospirillum sp. 1612]|uniref:5-oxoprolinase subunit PxpB n=1 Tax=Sulfurospirillum sp. 1612 TaxID=3094835 RepID=UPI002F9421F7